MSDLPDSEAQTFARGPAAAPRSAGGPAPGVAMLQQMGDYALESEIARGGMGVVYKARQVSLNRTVAFKMVLSGQFASTEDLDRFRVEAEAAASLDHPNIVPIYEVGEHAGHHFFSMKLVDGSSLAREMPRLAADPREGVRILAKVCRAIHYAHQRGILHRDLKPGNILLDKGGEPHVTDFGLAKRFEGDSNLTQTGTILGTPAYMAPEQASRTRGALTTAADVYSLGAILYELLTGRPPFVADSPIDTVMMLLERDPDRPGAVAPGCDRDLETIALKCLEKAPSARYASADALAEDLERWLAHEPISARRITTWERGVKWARRRPAIAGLIAAILAVAVAGFAGVIFEWRQAEAARLDASNKAAAESRARVNAQRAATAEAEARKGETAQRQAADAARLQAEQQRTIAVEQKTVAEQALASAETNLYFNNIDLADRECQAGNAARGDQLLAEAPAGRRDWEWHRLARLCHMEAAALPADAASIHGLAVSRDFERFVSASPDMTVKTWSATTSRLIGSVKLEGVAARPPGDVVPFAFSPDGTTLATAIFGLTGGGISQELKVWDTASGRQRFSLSATGDLGVVGAFGYSPDGSRIFVVSVTLAGGTFTRRLRSLDAGTGRELTAAIDLDSTPAAGGASLTGAGSSGFQLNTNLAFSPDGTRLAINGTAIKLVDPVSGRELVALERSDAPGKLTFTRDGAVIAAVSHGQNIKAWTVSDGKELWSASLGASVSELRFSPDGRQIVVAVEEGTLRVLDRANGRELRRLSGHGAAVRTLAFTPDGARLVSAGDDKTIRIWNLTPAPSPRVVDAAAAGSLRIGRLSRDGHVFAAISANGDFRAWDMRSGQPVVTMVPKQPPVVPGTPLLVFSEDGRRAAYVRPVVTNFAEGRLTAESELNVVDLVAGVESSSRPRGADVPAIDRTSASSIKETRMTLALEIALSPHGDRAALVAQGAMAGAASAGMGAGYLQFWDVGAGRSLAKVDLVGRAIQRLRFSPDGRTAAAAVGILPTGGRPAALEVGIYDTTTGALLRSLGPAQSPLAFSVDGARLAAVTSGRTITIWHPRSGAKLIALPQHTAAISAMAFNPGGTRLAALSSDGIVKVWDVALGRLVLVPREPSSIQDLVVSGTATGSRTESVAFSDDGTELVHRIITPGPRGMTIQIRTWDGTPRRAPAAQRHAAEDVRQFQQRNGLGMQRHPAPPDRLADRLGVRRRVDR